MASSLEKLELILEYNCIDFINGDHQSASWPVFDTLEKLKPRYVRYSYIDLDYRKALRRERLLQDRNDPFYRLTVDEIKKKYKFFPHTIIDILNLVGKDLQRPTKKNNPLTPKQSVCLALYLLGHGMFSTNSPWKTFDCNFILEIYEKLFLFTCKSVC